MAIKIANGVNESVVKNVANSFGVTFPTDYVIFLKDYNGMFISSGSYCTIPFLKVDNGNIDFQEMYGINTVNSGFDLVKANDIRDEVVVFEKPFVIGADPGGNPFLINCTNNDTAIYYWDRTHLHYDSNYDYKEINEEGNIYKVFDDFTQFYDAIILNVGGDKNIIKEIL